MALLLKATFFKGYLIIISNKYSNVTLKGKSLCTSIKPAGTDSTYAIGRDGLIREYKHPLRVASDAGPLLHLFHKWTVNYIIRVPDSGASFFGCLQPF